jgi:hypothetical protein
MIHDAMGIGRGTAADGERRIADHDAAGIVGIGRFVTRRGAGGR